MAIKVRKIYRVETASGKGMYYGNIWGKATDNYNTVERTPNPYNDRILTDHAIRGKHEGMHYGFKSKKQLKAWIFKKQWRVNLAEYGACVKVFEVPNAHVIIGDKQAVFNMKYANIVQTICIDEI